MKKLLTSLFFIASFTVFADPAASGTTASATVINSQQCTKLQNQVQVYRQQINQAFKTKDACGVGNATIKTHALIQDNLQCFPKYAKGEYNLFHVFDKIDTSITPYPANCNKPRAIVAGNDQKIKQALTKGDGCTAGKIDFQSFQVVQQNPGCFPKALTSSENIIKAIDTINASAPNVQ